MRLGVLFREKTLYLCSNFTLQFAVIISSSRASESRVGCFDQTISSYEECCRPAIEIGDVLDLFVELFGSARDQDRVGDAIALNDSSQANGILKLRLLFKAQIDDLQAAAVVLAIELFKEGSFFLAIGAPASAD